MGKYVGVVENRTQAPESYSGQARIAGSLYGSPERPLCEAVKEKPKLQWRFQYAGDVGTMGCPPRKATGVGQQNVGSIVSGARILNQMRRKKSDECSICGSLLWNINYVKMCDISLCCAILF